MSIVSKFEIYFRSMLGYKEENKVENLDNKPFSISNFIPFLINDFLHFF